MNKTFCAMLFLSVLTLAPQAADAYVYVHNDAEYSIELPDAPKGTTIWADQEEPIPFLENPPKYGMVGEIAKFKRTNVETGDIFAVEITFLKADRDLLLSMTQKKMLDILKELYTDVKLDTPEEHFSAGADTLKWATMTGFTVDKANSLHYNAAHFLTGLDTLMVVKVDYNVENEEFQKYYETLSKSIKFVGK